MSAQSAVEIVVGMQKGGNPRPHFFPQQHQHQINRLCLCVGVWVCGVGVCIYPPEQMPRVVDVLDTNAGEQPTPERLLGGGAATHAAAEGGGGPLELLPKQNLDGVARVCVG